MDELERFEAPGLPANWLNAWLAAIGVTVLLPGVKLSWTVDVVPYAVFWTSDHSEFVERLAERFPSVEELDRSAIARTHPESEFDFTRKPTLDAYASRASIERRDNGYLLASSWSDLIERRDGTELGYGAFDPPAPRGETLYSRARRCRELIEDVRVALIGTLLGSPVRVPANGLGFDCRRLSSGVQTDGPSSKVHVDPALELLVLSGLRLFPVRGNGLELRQRGWDTRPTRPGAFTWMTWGSPLRLDMWGVDALLDNDRLADGSRWQSIPFAPSVASDVTRAYFSESVT